MELINILISTLALLIAVVVCCILLDFYIDPKHRSASKNLYRVRLLQMRANVRKEKDGISHDPPITEPEILYLRDGPVLRSLDASMHWLTRRQRFLVFIKAYDAWSIESELDYSRSMK